MGIIKTSMIYLSRKPVRTILIMWMLGMIFLGELIGLLLYRTAEHARKDAFTYNGAAIFLMGESLNLDREDYEQIKNTDHVTGVGNWREIVVKPQDTKNVKDHIGTEPAAGGENDRGLGNDMVLLAQMDIPMYQLFRWEKSVSLIEGVFPDREHQGVLAESRYMAQNQLALGDEVSFYAEEFQKEVKLPICGVYQADTDFEILDSNAEGETVYIHSPYNVIYMDYYHALDLFGFDDLAKTGCDIYIDGIEHIQEVAESLRDMYGTDIEMFDNTTSYLDNECRIVGLMEQTSFMICTMIFFMGGIIILIVFSFFSNQYKEETGLYLILGESRRFCFLRYAVIAAGYILGGLFLGLLFYGVMGNWICDIISQVSIHVISNSSYHGTGGYATPNLAQGFFIIVNHNAVFAVKNMLIMTGVVLGSWLFTLVLPLHFVAASNPRELLRNKNI